MNCHRHVFFLKNESTMLLCFASIGSEPKCILLARDFLDNFGKGLRAFQIGVVNH